MSEFPRTFSVDTKPQATRYVMADGFYAVRGLANATGEPDAVFHLEEEGLTVLRKQEEAALPERRSRPVYRVGEHGPLAVPSGRVFVRFAEGQSLDRHRAEIENAGFRTVETLSYAPQAGWVEPTSGDPADAISQFEKLGHISGIEAVEPQMLMERRAR